MPYALNGGVRIYYEVDGGGPPLVLHTGFVSSTPDWSTLGYVDALRGDYQLILLDPRGQGQSDKPHAAEAYGPQHRVADVIAVLDALRIERAHFWGYSMGGRVGFDLGVQRPDRFLSLVLGGAHPFGSPPNVAWAEQLRQGMPAFLATNEAALSALPREIHERWLTSDPEALAAAALADRPSLEAHLAAVHLPTLIYCGDRDPAHEGARRAAEAMPTATFVSLPGRDHNGVVVASDLVVPHVRSFLASLAARPAPAPVREGLTP
jgi:pimeloyl-ACP methyl ester carboxylesterase